MATLPTVKVKNEASDSGWMRINEADFDPDVHERYEGDASGAASPDAVTIEHTGGGWYEIRRGGDVLEKVRGQEAAEARAAEVR